MSGSEPPGTYPPYDQGMEMDIFVKNMSGGVVYAKVSNKDTFGRIHVTYFLLGILPDTMLMNFISSYAEVVFSISV